uniref:Ribonuclease H-like domain-containing protein n=1 Tax=Tanacetum cinerariifolium TaxID=118510 RepID=A0A6L2MTP2_TANCI|nr:ribonuclease H-like domain-containing protein [Tanacetum cinerariifolium]
MAKVLINGLDAGNPLFLKANDHSNVAVISIKLTGNDNYKMRSNFMKIALKSKNKMGFVNGTCVKPITSVVLVQQWERCNAIVLSWIRSSLSPELYLGQVYYGIDFVDWEELQETYDKKDGYVIFNVIHKFWGLKQGKMSRLVFWEFGKFTSRDRESIKSYCSSFYKMMNEMTDWLDDTDEELDEQELEAHYSLMAKIQEVLPADSGSDVEPLQKVQYNAKYNVFANERKHSEQPESINDTYVVEKDDNNIITDSSDMCNNNNQAEQNAKVCDDERVVLANLTVNLKLDTDENKKIQKQLKKANATLTQELKERKSVLGDTNKTLRSLIELEIDI